MVLPSGSDTTFSVWIARPAEGAISSDSQAARNCSSAATCSALSVELDYSSNCSRLATSGCCVLGMAPMIALIRGSIRGSFTICSFIGQSCTLLGTLRITHYARAAYLSMMSTNVVAVGPWDPLAYTHCFGRKFAGAVCRWDPCGSMRLGSS